MTVLIIVPQVSKKFDVDKEISAVFDDYDIIYVDVFIPDFTNSSFVEAALNKFSSIIRKIRLTRNNYDKIIIYANGAAFHNFALGYLMGVAGIDADIYTFERREGKPVFVTSTDELSRKLFKL